jgi:phenylacetate-CoA ligase
MNTLLWKVSGRWPDALANSYNSLDSGQYAERSTIEALQLNKLRKLLQHAYQHTGYYKERFDRIEFNPDDLSSLDDLKQLPKLTREDLNSRLASMIATNIPPHELHYDCTGGSTGLATKFARNNSCLPIKKASEFRFNSWTGWQPGMKTLYYWPALMDFAKSNKSPSIVKARLYRRSLALYAGKLNKQILSEHRLALHRFRPHMIRAFPNSLEIFAEFLLQRNEKIPIPHGIICVGEPLQDHQRRLFQQAFCCEVFNCYVSRECGNIACECHEHQGLHVNEELLFVEVEKPDRVGIGHLLITDLENYGMPLIRYDIQDASRWIEEPCPCGRNLRRLDLSAARLTDYIISPVDDSFISGSSLVHYLLAEGPQVGRFQIIQDAPAHVLVKLAGTALSSDEGVRHINAVFETLFQGRMNVDFEFDSPLPLLKSGKFRFVDRTFDPNEKI